MLTSCHDTLKTQFKIAESKITLVRFFIHLALAIDRKNSRRVAKKEKIDITFGSIVADAKLYKEY